MSISSRIEDALRDVLFKADDAVAPPRLREALRYAVFPGGARVRPRLCLAVAHACGDSATTVAHTAAASIELLHCASLVHDDLPCFDDADVRRNKPAVHRVYGEALSVLVGDALIVMAFENLTRIAASRHPERLAPILTLLGRAAGSPFGLVAGQAWESEPDPQLEAYHRAKTGSLFTAAAACGAASAGAPSMDWTMFGERLGAAYQVADDLRDAAADPEEIGKPTLRDAALLRPSAVASLGLSGALRRFRSLIQDVLDAIPDCPGADGLKELVSVESKRLVPKALAQSAA
ncbi:MAG: polyprenyl synthetase family protein [Myxococcota bacterium]